MKKDIFLFISIFFAFGNITFSQESIGTKDSIFVVNIFTYDLNHGISMYHKFCENQKTFLKKGKLLSETTFIKAPEGEKFNSISEVVYYYYNSENKLIARETLNTSGNLLASKNLFYNSIGDLVLEINFKIDNNKPVLTEKTSYTYKANTTTKTTLSGKNKTVVTITKSADLIQETYSFNDFAVRADSIQYKEVQRVIKNSKVHSETTIIRKITGEIDTLVKSYSYSNQNQLVGEKLVKNNILQENVKYNYTAEGLKNSMNVSNADGKTIEYLGYETHEFYREFPIPPSISANYFKELKIKPPKN